MRCDRQGPSSDITRLDVPLRALRSIGRSRFHELPRLLGYKGLDAVIEGTFSRIGNWTFDDAQVTLEGSFRFEAEGVGSIEGSFFSVGSEE